MNDDKPSDKDDTYLPLPTESGQSAHDNRQPAADLVRKKVEAAYKKEPSVATEALDIAELGASIQRSRHQQFIYDLTNSGKSLVEIQTAWHEYYAGLTDAEKHQVWQEFYDAHSQASQFPSAGEAIQAKAAALTRGLPKAQLPKAIKELHRSAGELKKHISSRAAKRPAVRPKKHLQSLVFGVAVGAIAVLIVMFSFFNERFIAPLIQPSRSSSNIQLISSSAASSNNSEIIIPKINVQIPVVYDVYSTDEATVLKALENGVVNYGDSARPGQNGNVDIVGHSSNNIFNKGKYKFAFVLLSRMETGDTFYLQKDGQRYTYRIYKKEVVKPGNTSVLAPQTDKPAVATLITCDPPGTSVNRLIVVGEQIDPSPTANSPKVTDNVLATQTNIIPGNAPTLWSRLWSWFNR